MVALVLCTCGVSAALYINGSPSDGIMRQLAVSPVFSFLPSWTLERWAVPISRERNASVLKSVFEVFDRSVRPFLASVPIVLDSSATTAKSYSSKGYIGVSPDWDNTVRQSRYRSLYEQRGMEPDDPVFARRFKTDLLIHEYLHIIQEHLGIDRRSCFDAVARWYGDPRYGMPSPNGITAAEAARDARPRVLTMNRVKYILWFELYNYQGLSTVPQESWQNMQYGERYRSTNKGVEEFAYIGQEILSSGSSSDNYVKTGVWDDRDWKSKRRRLLELSPEIIALYKGIFSPEITL